MSNRLLLGSGAVRGPPAGTKPVDPLHAFPLDRLVPYLEAQVAGFRDAIKQSGRTGVDAVQVFQFSHGQSNPTFTIQINKPDGTDGGERDLARASRVIEMVGACTISHSQVSSLPLSLCTGTVFRRYVLRKKPSGKLLPSAHAIEREYR